MKLATATIILAALCFLASSASAATCRTHTDCPGHKETSFCNRIECDIQRNECITLPNPCPAACIEAEQRCADCLHNSDCASNICDLETLKCKSCTSDSDCAVTDWCHGDHEVCNKASGRCLPGRSPCENPDTCLPSIKQCFACRQDADCGVYNFCTNPVVCDRSTGGCAEHASFCTESELCDPARERCVECFNDNDCLAPADSFCGVPSRCNAERGVCEPLDDTKDLCNKPIGPGEMAVVSVCSEARKECIPERCNADADCDDGICSNGIETCVRHQCVRSFGVCEDGNVDSAPVEREDVQDIAIGMPCKTADDCASGGYICKIVTAEPPIARECRPCSTDAECSDGNPINGDEACNLVTGRCAWDLLSGDNVALSGASNGGDNSEANGTVVQGLIPPFVYNNTVVSSGGWFGFEDPSVNSLVMVLLIIVGSIIFVAIVWCGVKACTDSDNKRKKRSKKF